MRRAATFIQPVFNFKTNAAYLPRCLSAETHVGIFRLTKTFASKCRSLCCL